MSLLKLKKLEELYNPYKENYKYTVDTWETKLRRKEIIGNLSTTDLLFPEIKYEEDNYNTGGEYICEAIRSYYPYTLLYTIDIVSPMCITPKASLKQEKAFSQRVVSISECTKGIMCHY